MSTVDGPVIDLASSKALRKRLRWAGEYLRANRLDLSADAMTEAAKLIVEQERTIQRLVAEQERLVAAQDERYTDGYADGLTNRDGRLT